MKHRAQTDRILDFMARGKKITALQALNRFGEQAARPGVLACRAL
jgi:hypothetical protein